MPPAIDSHQSLQRFPIWKSSSADEFADKASTLFGARLIYNPRFETFSGSAGKISHQNIKLGLVSVSVSGQVTLPEVHEFRQRFLLEGDTEIVEHRQVIEGRTNGSIVIEPNQSLRMNFSSGFLQLMLMIDAPMLERKLAALLGAFPTSPVKVSYASEFSRRHNLALREVVLFLARQQGLPTGPLPQLMVDELEQAVVLGFLTLNENNFSRLLHGVPPSVSDGVVKRAEEYIEANWRRAIGIEELVSITGVSARSLHRHFVKLRGYSPASFAKGERLRRARALLMSPSDHSTVTGIAFECGFSNTGHFAAHFQRMFGETPSTTLDLARRKNR